MPSSINDCDLSPNSKRDITINNNNNNNNNNNLLIMNKINTNSDLQNPLIDLNCSLERNDGENDETENDEKHKMQFDNTAENKFNNNNNSFLITDILNFTARNNALKNDLESGKINKNNELLSLLTAMIGTSKSMPSQNSENIPNIQTKPTQNTIENWLQNKQSTSPNLASSTNNWPPSWLNDSSFTAAIAASANELYGNGVTSQLLLQQQQQQQQQLLYNQQHMLSNIAGTSIQQQQQQQQSFKDASIDDLKRKLSTTQYFNKNSFQQLFQQSSSTAPPNNHQIINENSATSSNASDTEKNSLDRQSLNASPMEYDISEDDQINEIRDMTDEESSLFLNEHSDHLRKKKTRTVFSRQQVLQLETTFETRKYLNGSERSQLATTLKLSETQVKIWFQNRRNKWKRSAVSMDDDSSSLSLQHAAAFQLHQQNQIAAAHHAAALASIAAAAAASSSSPANAMNVVSMLNSNSTNVQSSVNEVNKLIRQNSLNAQNILQKNVLNQQKTNNTISSSIFLPLAANNVSSSGLIENESIQNNSTNLLNENIIKPETNSLINSIFNNSSILNDTNNNNPTSSPQILNAAAAAAAARFFFSIMPNSTTQQIPVSSATESIFLPKL